MQIICLISTYRFRRHLSHPSVPKEDDLYTFSDALETMNSSLSVNTCTGKLWINYLIRTHILRIYVEMTDHWELHLYAIIKMIPIFHAAGHFAYARSACRYELRLISWFRPHGLAGLHQIIKWKQWIHIYIYSVAKETFELKNPDSISLAK